MFEKKIIHRDLKPENILLDEKSKAYISDVGAAKTYDTNTQIKNPKDSTAACGTITWMSPEMKAAFASEQENIKTDMSKVDVFSFGMIVLAALDTKCFFDAKGRLNVDENEMLIFLNELEKKKAIKDPEFMKALRLMLKFKPVERISLEDLHQKFITHKFQGVQNVEIPKMELAEIEADYKILINKLEDNLEKYGKTYKNLICIAV